MPETKVRIPTGQIITVRHPEGASAEQILRFAQREFQMRQGPSMVPSSGQIGFGPGRHITEQIRQEFERGNEAIPFAQRLMNDQLVTAEQGREALPLAMGTALSLAPGGVIPSALMFGAGGVAGESLKPLVGGETDLPEMAGIGLRFTRDALIGGAAIRALSPAARAMFGRAATPEGEQAVEFARRRTGELLDEAAAARGTGEAMPTSGRLAVEQGAPRISVDSITDGSLLDATRFMLVGEATSNARARQAAQFINRELLSFTGEVPKSESIVQDAKHLIFSDDSLRSLRQFQRIGDADKWIDSVVTPSNATALNQLAQSSPELHRQILAKNLENVFNRFTRASPELGFRVLDGQGLRKWYVANRNDITRTYGFGTSKKLDDFTNYAQFLDSSVAQAERGVGGSLGRLGVVGRAAAETGGVAFLPNIALPVQGAAWVLGNTLMNPSSATFRFFSLLPKAGKAARAAAQAGAVEAEAGRSLGRPSEVFRGREIG